MLYFFFFKSDWSDNSKDFFFQTYKHLHLKISVLMIFTKHANVTARRPCGFIFFLILIKQLTFCKTSVIRIVFFVRNVYKRRKHLKTHRIYRYCLQNVFGYFRMLCYSGVGGIRSADTRRMDRNQTYWLLPHASRIICMLIFLIELNIFMLKLFKICVQCGLYIKY